MSEKCEHKNFSAAVAVNRLEDTGRFVADIAIRCLDCGIPFQFMGLEPGLRLDGASVSLDGLEAKIGIHPQGLRPTPLQILQGINIKQFN
jgi:hypothetical protein